MEVSHSQVLNLVDKNLSPIGTHKNLINLQSKIKSQVNMETKIYHRIKNHVIKTTIVAAACVGIFYSCKKSADTTSSVDCTGSAKSFTTDVNPIIQNSCTTNSGCHGSGSHNGPGELLTYTEVFNSRSDIRTAVLTGAMPQTGSLASTQKTSIICWIDNGALNN